MSKTFCIKPWTHAMVDTDGAIKMCCLSKEPRKFNLKTHSISEWWTSDFVAGVREQMLSGNQVPACTRCYEAEQHGGVSFRQISNKEYKVIEKHAANIVDYFKYPLDAPIDIEFGLTNLCNQKCLMCFEDTSSSIANENRIIKISKINQSDYEVTHSEVEKIKEWILTKPKLINFRGGESMIVPEIEEILVWALDNGLLADTKIHITTNGSKLTNKWIDIISKISDVTVMLSVDAFGKLNEYIRYGSKWETIVESSRILSSMPNVNFVVHATLMNLNVLAMSELITWCDANKYYLDIGLLTEPVNFKVGVLPPPLLELAKNRLSETPGDIALSVIKIIDNVVPLAWDNFKEEINMRDKVRKNSILSVIPELGPYWNAKT